MPVIEIFSGPLINDDSSSHQAPQMVALLTASSMHRYANAERPAAVPATLMDVCILTEVARALPTASNSIGTATSYSLGRKYSPPTVISRREHPPRDCSKYFWTHRHCLVLPLILYVKMTFTYDFHAGAYSNKPSRGTQYASELTCLASHLREWSKPHLHMLFQSYGGCIPNFLPLLPPTPRFGLQHPFVWYVAFSSKLANYSTTIISDLVLSGFSLKQCLHRKRNPDPISKRSVKH